MTAAVEPRLMTTEELNALPDDGRERWLIRGELREGEMTKRNRGHSRVESKIAYLLHRWLEALAEPRGEVLCGEAGFRLRKSPDTTVGIDVAYISHDVARLNTDDSRIVEGCPVLAVEVLSPSDKHENVAEKVQEYLDVGVKVVWLVDVRFRTVTVYRSDAEPQLFNATQSIAGEPHLPGLRFAVREVFA